MWNPRIAKLRETASGWRSPGLRGGKWEMLARRHNVELEEEHILGITALGL